MKQKQMVEDALKHKMETYKKYQKAKDKEELDRKTKELMEQIQTALRLELINMAVANQHLADLEKHYVIHLQNKGYHDKDIEWGRERLFATQRIVTEERKESNKGFGMSDWKNEINRNSNASSSVSGNSEREEISHDKQEEREEEKREIL